MKMLTVLIAFNVLYWTLIVEYFYIGSQSYISFQVIPQDGGWVKLLSARS